MAPVIRCVWLHSGRQFSDPVQVCYHVNDKHSASGIYDPKQKPKRSSPAASSIFLTALNQVSGKKRRRVFVRWQSSTGFVEREAPTRRGASLAFKLRCVQLAKRSKCTVADALRLQKSKVAMSRACADSPRKALDMWWNARTSCAPTSVWHAEDCELSGAMSQISLRNTLDPPLYVHSCHYFVQCVASACRRLPSGSSTCHEHDAP